METLIQVKIISLKFDRLPWKTIGHHFYANSSFVQHFVALCEFKLELQSRNAPIRAKFVLWLWPLSSDLDFSMAISPLSIVIIPENFIMIRWEKHCEKGVTDRQAEKSVHRAAWLQYKYFLSYCGQASSYRQTDGQMQAMTIPLCSSRLRGKPMHWKYQYWVENPFWVNLLSQVIIVNKVIVTMMCILLAKLDEVICYTLSDLVKHGKSSAK